MGSFFSIASLGGSAGVGAGGEGGRPAERRFCWCLAEGLQLADNLVVLCGAAHPLTRQGKRGCLCRRRACRFGLLGGVAGPRYRPLVWV